MGKTINTKHQVVTIAKELRDGLAKHFSNATPVTFAGRTYTRDQLASTLQELIDLRAKVEGRKASLAAAIATEATRAPTLIALERHLKAFVKATFTQAPEVLADFGISSKARTPQTTEAKALANARRAATRAARHTMGPKQKVKVKGDVVGVVVTPARAHDSDAS
jgi:hypothetical protein